jgi:hypothetical protein
VTLLWLSLKSELLGFRPAQGSASKVYFRALALRKVNVGMRECGNVLLLSVVTLLWLLPAVVTLLWLLPAVVTLLWLSLKSELLGFRPAQGSASKVNFWAFALRKVQPQK